jgi:hypothetical protein
MKNRQFRVILLFTLVAVAAIAGAFMLRAVAQNRPRDPAIEGPAPASQVETPQPTVTPAASTGLRTVASENFDQAPAGWVAVNSGVMPDQQGEWLANSGKLEAKAPLSESFDDSIYLAPVDTSGIADISAQVYPQGNQVVGLAFRASDKGYYLFRVFRADANGKAKVMLQRYDARSGRYTSLAQNDQGQGYALGRWQTLLVKLNGDLITCYFEGQQVFEVHDKTYDSGKAGVYTIALGEVLFDNFTVLKP